MNIYKFHTEPKSLDYHDTAFDEIPKLVWEKYEHQPKELKKRESALAKDSKIAYQYAFRILKGPFLAGEAAIAKDPPWAYWYAQRVLKEPFPAGEAAIAADPKLAYFYALNVLKGPFSAGETAIAGDLYFAYQYASKVLKLSRAETEVWGKNEHL